jgi:hypothetical protein
MPDVIERAATWGCLTALFLDFCMVAFGGGYLIALATGETTGRGFHLHGASTLALWALIALYFVVGRRYGRGEKAQAGERQGAIACGDVTSRCGGSVAP